MTMENKPIPGSVWRIVDYKLIQMSVNDNKFSNIDDDNIQDFEYIQDGDIVLFVRPSKFESYFVVLTQYGLRDICNLHLWWEPV